MFREKELYTLPIASVQYLRAQTSTAGRCSAARREPDAALTMDSNRDAAGCENSFSGKSRRHAVRLDFKRMGRSSCRFCTGGTRVAFSPASDEGHSVKLRRLSVLRMRSYLKTMPQDRGFWPHYYRTKGKGDSHQCPLRQKARRRQKAGMGMARRDIRETVPLPPSKRAPLRPRRWAGTARVATGHHE